MKWIITDKAVDELNELVVVVAEGLHVNNI